jgi:hypothetical protein
VDEPKTVNNLVFGPPQQAGITARQWFRLGAVFLSWGFVALMAENLIDNEDWWLHGAWCVIGMILAAGTIVRFFRLGVRYILCDHLMMFTGVFVAYFLFGALFLAAGPDDGVSRMLAYYPINAREAMRVDAVNAIGFGLALMAAALVRGRWIERQSARVSRVFSRVPAHIAVLVFLLVGGFASLNVVTLDLGLRDGIVSGTWRALAGLSFVAIFLSSAYRGRWQAGLWLIAILVALLDVAGGLLLFNKTAVVMPLAMLVAGVSIRPHSYKILLLGLMGLVLVFAAIAGPIAYSRNTYGDEGGRVLQARWDLLKEAFLSGRAKETSEAYNPWARFCYTAPQAAALDFHDLGFGGNEVSLIPWLFIPRALAPNKPIITQSGTKLNTKITGNVGSSTGIGIFASGYYNGGWLMLGLASILCGLILSQTSAIARAIISNRALLLLPFALFGLHIAFRIDGTFVADYIGAFVFILYPILFLSFLLSWKQGGRRMGR